MGEGARNRRGRCAMRSILVPLKVKSIRNERQGVAMALAGRGAVAIWHDIAPEGRDEFYAWHGLEHMPERLAIPGFLRGRRYVAVEGAPEFFNLYETDSTAVLTGAAYLARLNDPTPWTLATVKHFRGVARSLCEVVDSHGAGLGGLCATYRYDVDEGRRGGASRGHGGRGARPVRHPRRRRRARARRRRGRERDRDRGAAGARRREQRDSALDRDGRGLGRPRALRAGLPHVRPLARVRGRHAASRDLAFYRLQNQRNAAPAGLIPRAGLRR